MISFHVVQSKSTTSQSVLELGQITSQAHCPSAQSCTSKLKGSHSSKFIVTVVVFQLLELVTLVIQFQSAPSCPSCQFCPSCQSFQSFQSAHAGHVAPVSHLGIVKLSTAALEVPELVTDADVQAAQVVVLPTVIVAAAPSTQSFQSAQSLPSFPSLPSAHGVHGSHWSHLSPLSSSLLANLASSETESKIRILSSAETSDFTSISDIGFTGTSVI